MLLRVVPLMLELIGLAATYWVYSVSMVVLLDSWHDFLVSLT